CLSRLACSHRSHPYTATVNAASSASAATRISNIAPPRQQLLPHDPHFSRRLDAQRHAPPAVAMVDDILHTHADLVRRRADHDHFTFFAGQGQHGQTPFVG